MDKGDVPRDYALILHGCLLVTMETMYVCVYVGVCGCVCALQINITLCVPL